MKTAAFANWAKTLQYISTATYKRSNVFIYFSRGVIMSLSSSQTASSTGHDTSDRSVLASVVAAGAKTENVADTSEFAVVTAQTTQAEVLETSANGLMVESSFSTAANTNTASGLRADISLQKSPTEKSPTEDHKEEIKKPRLPTNLPVEFVDLYEVIGVGRDALIPDIRKRITEMYLDAQNNLDHRNAKKKLHYQQLFEILLPQSRHLLLEPDRRAEYDNYLDEHKDDASQRAVAERTLSTNEFLSTSNSVEEAAQAARVEEEQLSPEQLIARRKELWEKWEESLSRANDPLAQLKFSMPELKIRAVHRKEYMERALVDVHKADMRRAKEAAIRRQKEQRQAEEAEQQSLESQSETRLQHIYNETTQSAIATARLYWGGGVGGMVLVIGLMALYYCNIAFESRPANLFIALLTFLALGAFGSWRASSMGVEKIQKCRKSPDALRQQASLEAARIVREKYPFQVGQKEKTDDQEIEAATREEISNQSRLLRRASIAAMTKLNTVAWWTFAAGIGGLILGFIGVFLFDLALGTDLGRGRPDTILKAVIVAVIFGLSVCFGGWSFARGQNARKNAT